MSNLLEAAGRFLPAYHLKRWRAHRAYRATPEADPFPAAILVGAVEGGDELATLLEAPAAHASHAIQSFLDRCLCPLLDLVQAHGGDVLELSATKWVALWPQDPEGDEKLSHLTYRAAQCGLALHRHFADLPPEEPLRLRLAVGAGEITVLHLGGVGARWMTLMSSPSLTSAHLALSEAEPGLVVLTPESWVLLHAKAIARRLDHDFRSLLSLNQLLDPRALEPPTLSGLALPAMLPYLSAEIRRRLEADDPPDARTVGAMTILAANLPHVRQPLLEEAHLIVQAIQSGLYLYEGHFESLHLDQRGLTLIAYFAGTDMALRGLQAAHALSESLGTVGHRPSLGLGTALAFAGEIGNQSRRAVTILSRAVPAALRLMQSAAGELLCDATTFQIVKRHVPFDALGSLRPDPRETPIPAFRPRHEAFPRRARTLVGREAERLILSEKLRSLMTRNEGGVVLLEGDGGVGKSRLVSELAEQCLERGTVCLIGEAEARRQHVPYHAWTPIFREIFHLADLDSDSSPGAAILSLLSAAPDLCDLAPLLQAVLPVALPETPLSETLPTEGRAILTRDLMAGLIQEKAKEGPLLLVIEDAQWLDSASWALLDLVAQRIHPMLLIVTSQPWAADPPGIRLLAAMPRALRMRLKPLPDHDVTALVCQHLGVSAMPEVLAQLIQAQAGGHALLAEETAYALREAGHLMTAGGRCGEPHDELRSTRIVPRTLEGLLTSRLARLTPRQQRALELASVLGQTFTVSAMVGACLEPEEIRDLPGLLATLPPHGLAMTLPAAGGMAFRFRHPTYQDLIYGRIDESARRRMHLRAAQWLQSEHLPPARVADLADHYARAEEPAAAASFLFIAGLQAQELGARDEAALSFRQALEWLELTALQELAPSREDVLFHLAAAEASLGHSQEAWNLLEHRARLAPETPAALRLKASLAEQLHGVDEAMGYYRQALAVAGPTTPDGARVTLRIAHLHFLHGNPSSAMAVGLQAEALFRVLGMPHESGHAHLLLGRCYADQRRETEAIREFEAALGILAPAFDFQGEAEAHARLGHLHQEAGRWDVALDHLNECLARYRRLGQRQPMTAVLNALGDLQLKRGHSSQAEASYYEAMRVSQEAALERLP